jgi:hypothetical protein
VPFAPKDLCNSPAASVLPGKLHRSFAAYIAAQDDKMKGEGEHRKVKTSNEYRMPQKRWDFLSIE